MTARHALVIGIPTVDEDSRFEPIPEDVVRTDVTQMCRALAQSGYEITALGVRPEEDVTATLVDGPPTLNRCMKELRNAFDRVPEGGTLVVYFSGHGVRLGGADYLVPEDGGSPDRHGRLDKDSLIPVGFGKAIDDCRAATVVAFIDACRDVPDSADLHGTQKLPELPGLSFVLVRGCAPEQRCRWEEGQGSMFTRALVRSLHRNASARTLTEVIEATRAKLRELDPGDPQRPDVAVSGSPAGLEATICEGIRLLDDLRVAVDEARLWTLAGGATELEPVRSAIRALVQQYGLQVQTQRARLAADAGLSDRWSDDAYPRRVLDALHRLLTRPGQEPPRLHPVEAAALVAAPFLREAVLSLGLHKIPQVYPRDFTRRFGTGLRADFENVLADHEQLVRRAAGLPDARSEARDDLAMWLAHRWILEREDLWEDNTTRGWCQDLARAACAGIDPPPGPGRIGELGDVLRDLVRCLTAVLTPDNEPAAHGNGDLVRPRPLGYLLSVAGVMGADPRRMSGVLADHVGAHDPIDLSGLHEALAAEVTWRRSGDETVLDAVCRHQALHVALEELAAEADEACVLARHALDALPPSERALMEGVPARCSEDLRAERNAYDKPLLRFHLADDRVRDLLMGPQLYSDPAVAIRELYQNALDACRYRHMRLRYTTGKEQPGFWSGRIVFRQGVDEAGREYIECEDNGVGMTESVLRHAFTAAGTRFVHTSAFRREEARWRRKNPSYRLYPNSQFGIGVFSYFMLADEALLWTAATNEDGLSPSDHYYLRIPGHGGLFRVRRDVPVPDGIKTGGSVVRLLLSAGTQVDALTALANHLVVSEYDVEVWRNGEQVGGWSPKVPQHPDISSGVPHPGADHVWWIDGPARLLSDGLLVDKVDRGFGWLVNLTGAHQPRLNVDRRRILDYDKSWLRAALAASIPNLETWSQFTFQWMWRLTRSDAPLATHTYERHRGLALQVGAGQSVTARLDETGCFSLDEALFRGRSTTDPMFWFLLGWRRAVWRAAGSNPLPTAGVRPVRTDGFPVPDPGDAAVLQWTAAGLRLVQAWPNTFVDAGRHALNFDGLDVRFQVRRLVMSGLDVSPVRHLDADLPLMFAAGLGWFLDDVQQPPPLIALVILAARLQLSVATVAELLGPVLEAHGQVRLVIPEAADFVPQPFDVLLLSRDQDGIGPWNEVLTPEHVEGIKEGRNADQVQERVDRLVDAGIVSAPSGAIDAPDDLAAVARRVVRLNRRLGPYDVTVLAHEVGRSVADTYALVAEIAERLRLPKPRCFGTRLSQEVPRESDLHCIERDLIGPDLAEDGVSIARLVEHWRRSCADLSSAELVEYLGRHDHLFALPDNIDGAEVFGAAVELGVSIDRAAEVLTELVAGCPGPLRVAAPTAAVGTVRPDRHEFEALIRVDQARNSWRAVSPADVADLAASKRASLGERLAQLALYRDLGALAPEVDPATAEYRPDEHDGALLRIAVAGDWTVSALRLVLAAGRYGFTVVEAYDRIARFRGYGVVMDIERGDCPDEIVHWQDPIVLTEFFDGAEPVLAGSVGNAAVRRAAESVHESPAVTRERLVKYARLFGLQVEELA